MPTQKTNFSMSNRPESSSITGNKEGVMPVQKMMSIAKNTATTPAFIDALKTNLQILFETKFGENVLGEKFYQLATENILSICSELQNALIETLKDTTISSKYQDIVSGGADKDVTGITLSTGMLLGKKTFGSRVRRVLLNYLGQYNPSLNDGILIESPVAEDFNELPNGIIKMQGDIGETIKDTLEIQLFKQGYTSSNPAMGRYVALYGMGDSLFSEGLQNIKKGDNSKNILTQKTRIEKARFAINTPYLDKNILPELVHELEALMINNMHPIQERFGGRLGQRMRVNMLKFITGLGKGIENDIDITQLTTDLITTTRIIKDIFSNESVYTYLDQLVDGDVSLIERIYRCVSKNEVNFRILTCPDYSGFVDATGQRQFDFQTLGTDTGIVTKKSFSFTESLVEIFKRHLSEAAIVKVHHYLPTFEFPNGFSGGNEVLSYEQCVTRLQASGEKIGDQYKTSGVDASVGLSADVSPDVSFFEQKKQKYNELKERFTTDSGFRSIVAKILEQRKGLYTKRFPKGDMLDEVYTKELYDRLLMQSAEYLVMGEKFTTISDNCDIMIASDSRPMYGLYPMYGYPVLYGQSTTSTDYLGA